MFCFRPVKREDFDTLCEIAKLLGPGFASLPNDPQLIEKKIEHSMRSFSLEQPPKERSYFFVLEDVSLAKMVGTAAIDAQAAFNTPFYNFTISSFAQVCDALHKHQQHQLLNLSSHYEEASLLSTLFLRADYRGAHQGRFLSRSRALFISQFPDLFSDLIVANMRGVFDKNGVSPFWEAVLRPFFNMDFYVANYLAPTRGEEFIADLAPRQPIYLDLLPLEVRNTIAKTHENTTPARHVLELEGLSFRDTIDVFDGGPILEGQKMNLKTVKESQQLKIAKIETLKSNVEIDKMIANTSMDFRAILGGVVLDDNHEAQIDSKVAQLLNVSEGNSIRITKVK